MAGLSGLNSRRSEVLRGFATRFLGQFHFFDSLAFLGWSFSIGSLIALEVVQHQLIDFNFKSRQCFHSLRPL